MFRLFRAFVAEGLGLGGLVWMMSIFSSEEAPASRSAPAAVVSFDSLPSEVVTLRKPAIYASLEPPVESQQSTFFRGTDSLLERP